MRSRKNIIFYILLTVLLALIQESFFNDLRLFGAKPNLALVLVCISAVRMDYLEAIVFGASSGIFIDIVYGRYIGLYGLLFMYIALSISFITQQVNYYDKLWWPVAVAPIPLFIYGLAESFIVRLMAVYAGEAQVLFEFGFGNHLVGRILPVVFYNCLCIAVLCVPVIKFLDWKKGGY